METIKVNEKEYITYRVIETSAFTMELRLSCFKGQLPYFSFTGTKYKVNKDGSRNKRNIWLCSGAIGHEFMKAYPQFADLERFHCRDINGYPMYPFENGMYGLGYTKDGDTETKYNHYNKEDRIKFVARHFLITKTEAEALMNSLSNMSAEERVNTVNNLIEELKPIWKEEANRLLEKYYKK